MKITAYKNILLAFIGACGWFVASSQKQPDSLLQYLVISAKNNPTVQQKFYEYQAALQKVPQVGALPDPELNVGVFIQPMELVDGRQNADIKLMQMFPWFGTLKSAKDEMSLMAKAKFESFRDAKLQVFFDVKKSWYELQKVQQDIRISEKNLDILHTIERLTLVKFKAAPAGGNSSPASGTSNPAGSSQSSSANPQGMQTMGGNSGGQSGASSAQSPSAMQSSSMGSSSGGSGLADLYRIQIEIGELENNIELLKTQRNTIEARFNAYLNRPSASPVQLPDQLIPDSLGLSLLAVTDSMLSHNPMLGMLQYEQQSLDARQKMVTKMGYPMMGLGLNYSVISKSAMSTSSMNGKDMIMPMATVTLPIYRNKYNAMKIEAELLKSANKENYQATANSLQTNYYEAVQLFKDGQRRVKLYDSQSDLAGKTLDIMLKGLSTSVVPLTDILRVRQQLLDYEFKKIEAVVDYNTAISWLQRLMASSPIQEN
ncbi:MAG: TolC family protein [Bacteroidales bacterium]|jgi:outer membrane protein TolC|nr:TolC family protein [Bacteroidales bacterium]